MYSDSFDLRQVFDLYPEMCLKCYGVTLDFEKLEREFLPIKLGNEKFSQKHLNVLESEYSFYNEFRVPRINSGETNTIKRALSVLKLKDQATIEKLYNVIGSIEIVSCILRLMDPKNYGILSPMLENLLYVRGNTQIEKYMNFIEDLDNLAEHYHFDRIADTQAALWTLANIINSPSLKYAPRICDIYAAYEEHPNLIKKVIAKNAMGPFKIQDNLFKAELILDSDFVVAGILASKELEILIKALCEKYGIKTWERTLASEFRCLFIWELASKLFQNKFITRNEHENIKLWWVIRNNLIHEADVKISRDEVSELIREVFQFRARHFSKQYIQKTRSSYLVSISH
ncbi:hypothetical protein KA005_81575 [bacterium]|nr:hypothetical protein [bacterium]